MSAFRSKADIDQPLPTNLDYEYTPLAPRRGPPPRGRHGGRPGATGSGAIRVESVPADGDDRTLRARARKRVYTGYFPGRIQTYTSEQDHSLSLVIPLPGCNN
jgi:hypothetical protein